MAEIEAQQSPQPTTEIQPAEEGKANNTADTYPNGRPAVVMEILGARWAQLHVASDCKYCDVATLRKEWRLFPARELLAAMKEDEHVVEWTEWGTDGHHMICRACIRGYIQSIVDESGTCSNGWGEPVDWAGVGDPGPMPVGTRWGVSDLADGKDTSSRAPIPVDWEAPGV
ncbi:hypothetical protein FPV67DRAFT_1669874 [Lyophyllum atratum]|nr:hypothetical protein FPV67DRAFT_1669874 [Lyophyllum atratum]